MSPVFRRSRRPVTPVREVPTSDDPVGEAIAAAPSLHRGEGPGEPPLERLRELVHVSDMGRTGEAGFDTQILLDDEVRDVAAAAVRALLELHVVARPRT